MMGDFYKKFGIIFGFFVFIYYFLIMFMLPSCFKMFLNVIEEHLKERQ
jgi:hypothetical protein